MIVVLRARVSEIMTRECGNTVHHREIGTGILRQSIEFLFFRSKRVPIFDRGTGSKSTRIGQAQICFLAG